MTTQAIQIEVMGRSLRVNCPAGQEQALQNAAAEFDSRIKTLSERTKMSNSEQLLIFAALNICHELQDLRAEHAAINHNMNTRIELLQKTIETALVQHTKAD
ncbi:cell division protein ZapA [Vibrio sp. SS-MA-C1-2]|uniref:cell division protein ZapA n=1 Tax=Vibrio sp. SS-MA-C1-2 TaxID=2908646 RepID=UPI001F421BC2|nr:cell division protein ZapA [Vibrio sp. SS-MA-C1-2]UJF19045.1 cell division protein ZapA [Vibrio sp. SS-MA-C1-2]